MNTFETLRRAIYVRNQERMDRGESALTEMWITRQTQEAFLRDCEAFMFMMVRCEPTGKTTLEGVHLRVIGT